MLEQDRYDYSVVWLAEQGAFAGLCNNFIGMNYLAPTYDEALDGIRDLVLEKVTVTTK